MSQFPPFVLPPGVNLRVTDKGLHLSYEGDIDLQECPEPGFALVEAGGDLEVRLPRVTGTLRAGGTLRIRGDVAGGRLHGRHVVLGRQRVDCLAITATESITIGPATIACDAIIAPLIHLDPKAGGRVTVIESRNDRGATKIKGGFSLADYQDMFGKADEFLAARGLARLTDARPARSTGPIAPEFDDEEDADTGPVDAPTPRGAAGRTLRPPPGVDRGYKVPNSPPTYPPPPSGSPAPPPGTSPSIRRIDEDEDDPSLSVSFGSMEPMVADAELSSEADAVLQQQLAEALGRIMTCYEGAELPPAVQQLRSLVEQRDYASLREDITDVWNGLLGFHQQRGIRPHHQVTHAFNLIHGLVQT